MKNNKLNKIILIIIVCVIIALVLTFNNNIIDTIQNNTQIDVGELPQNFIIADETDLQIIFFNVGDADCILLKDNRDIMLIDSGENSDGKYIVEYLKQLGITEIKY